MWFSKNEKAHVLTLNDIDFFEISSIADDLLVILGANLLSFAKKKNLTKSRKKKSA